jgi:hypothetical protein
VLGAGQSGDPFMGGECGRGFAQEPDGRDYSTVAMIVMYADLRMAPRSIGASPGSDACLSGRVRGRRLFAAFRVSHPSRSAGWVLREKR